MRVQEILFAILRNQICGEDLNILSLQELDYETQVKLYKLSCAHDLGHIVANALFESGARFDEKLALAFKKQQMISAFRYEKIKADLSAICKTFDELNIEYIPLKGSVIREFYKQTRTNLIKLKTG